MLVRLLFAVLTLAGPMPVRICTCDAAHHAPPADPAPVSACGHRHHADEPDEPTPGARSDDHHCDCPAVTPQPATPPAPADAAADGVATAPALLDAPALSRLVPRTLRTDPPPKAIPLYLSLLTLRL